MNSGPLGPFPAIAEACGAAHSRVPQVARAAPVPDTNFHEYPNGFAEERNDGILPNDGISDRPLHSVIWSNSVIPSAFRLPPRVRFFVRDGMIPERRGGRLGAARAGDFAVSWGRGKT